MRRSRTVLIALLTAALAGCGDREPSAEEQVRSTLSGYATALKERDYERLCDEVFAPELLSGLRQIGLPCEVAMARANENVKEPKIEVSDIKVDGRSATARVKSSAKGQQPSTDTVRLTRVEGKWKVAALGE